jgi:hypothetical protein
MFSTTYLQGERVLPWIVLKVLKEVLTTRLEILCSHSDPLEDSFNAGQLDEVAALRVAPVEASIQDRMILLPVYLEVTDAVKPLQHFAIAQNLEGLNPVDNVRMSEGEPWTGQGRLAQSINGG